MNVAKYRTRSRIVDAFRFDPRGEHRLNLPDGVQGVPSPGADNWAYDGCRFWLTIVGDQQMAIDPGDWILTDADGRRRAMPDPRFIDSFEPRAASADLATARKRVAELEAEREQLITESRARCAGLGTLLKESTGRIADLEAKNGRLAQALKVVTDKCEMCGGNGTVPIGWLTIASKFNPMPKPCPRCSPLRALLPQSEEATNADAAK